MTERYIAVVTPADNVATLLRDTEAGEVLEIEVGDDVTTVEAEEDIVFGHKLAIRGIEPGESIIKYGKSIGNATVEIASGEWVHVHNVESNYGRGDLAADDTATAVRE